MSDCVCVCVCLAFLSFLALYMQYVCGVRSSSFTNIRNKIIMHKQRAKQRLYLRGYQHKQAGTHRHSRLCTNIDSSVISIGHHHHHTHKIETEREKRTSDGRKKFRTLTCFFIQFQQQSFICQRSDLWLGCLTIGVCVCVYCV